MNTNYTVFVFFKHVIEETIFRVFLFHFFLVAISAFIRMYYLFYPCAVAENSLFLSIKFVLTRAHNYNAVLDQGRLINH